MARLSAGIILAALLYEWVAAEPPIRHDKKSWQAQLQPNGEVSLEREDAHEDLVSPEMAAPSAEFVQQQNTSQRDASQEQKEPPAPISQTSYTDSDWKTIVGAVISASSVLVVVALGLQKTGLEDDQSLAASEDSVHAALRTTSKDDYAEFGALEAIFRERADKGIPALCDDPGIYVTMWATRSLSFDQIVLFCVTVTLQLFVPLYLFPADRFLKKFPSNASQGARAAWPLVLVYTISTIKGVLQRVTSMLILRSTIQGWQLVLWFGALTLLACSFLTIFATVNLFFGDMAVGQILLNACAVNFIPDVDKTLLTLLGSVDSRSAKHYLVSKRRLAKVAEVWQTSKEHEAFRNAVSKPFMEAFKSMPFVMSMALLDAVLVLACFVAMFDSLVMLGFQISEVDLR